MFANLRPVLVITQREIRDQFRDWRVIFPIFGLTLLFPALMNFTAAQIVGFVRSQGGYDILAERMIPFLLMIVGFFPISVSLVIALESFVGESERHSIEPLLSTPLADWQLYLGKLLASLMPPLVGSYLGAAVYLWGVYSTVGWQPPVLLLIQILILIVVQALVMVSGAVVVSTQTTSVRAANLLASFIVIPMALLIQGESVIMFWADYSVLWLAIFGQLVIAGLLIRTGLAHFNREDLLGRELDTINLRWMWSVFWKAFAGEAHSVREWFGREIRRTLRMLWIPTLFMLLVVVAGTWVGETQAHVFVLPSSAFDPQKLQNIDESYFTGLGSIGFYEVAGVGYIWLHNLRAIALATVLGIFSFGVLGVILLMLPMALAGYFAGTAAAAGVSPWLFLTAFVLPHGILEIPAIIITGAAILRLGATMVTPSPGKTVGEAWMEALADWIKVILTTVLPLLLGAALLEVFLTPRVVVALMGG